MIMEQNIGVQTITLITGVSSHLTRTAERQFSLLSHTGFVKRILRYLEDKYEAYFKAFVFSFLLQICKTYILGVIMRDGKINSCSLILWIGQNGFGSNLAKIKIT